MEKHDLTDGLLELYVSGALPPEQMEEISQQIADSPELEAEVERIEASFIAFAELHAPSISTATEKEILQSGRHAFEKNKGNPASSKDAERIRPLRKNTNWRWMAAASVALIISLGLNIYLYFQLQNRTGELAALEAEQETLTNNYNRIQAQFDESRERLADVIDPNTRTVILPGTGANLETDRQVRVFWNEGEQIAYIDASELPEPPEGQTYQLWRISSLDPLTPHDAGLLEDFSSNEEKFFSSISLDGPAAAFAITLEPEGGSDNPTLEQLYVLGQV